MPSPTSFAVFALVNAIVWPGFALAYWFTYQREEERLLDAIGRGETEEENASKAHKDAPSIGGDS
jgi:hypothetical protein